MNVLTIPLVPTASLASGSTAPATLSEQSGYRFAHSFFCRPMDHAAKYAFLGRGLPLTISCQKPEMGNMSVRVRAASQATRFRQPTVRAGLTGRFPPCCDDTLSRVEFCSLSSCGALTRCVAAGCQVGTVGLCALMTAMRETSAIPTKHRADTIVERTQLGNATSTTGTPYLAGRSNPRAPSFEAAC